jgi:hypothetical protein
MNGSANVVGDDGDGRIDDSEWTAAATINPRQKISI